MGNWSGPISVTLRLSFKSQVVQACSSTVTLPNSFTCYPAHHTPEMSAATTVHSPGHGDGRTLVVILCQLAPFCLAGPPPDLADLSENVAN